MTQTKFCGNPKTRNPLKVKYTGYCIEKVL